MGASNHHGLGSGGTNACSPYAQPSNRPPAFRVRVYNDGLFKSLLDDGRTSSTSPRSLGRSAKSRPSRPPQEDRSEAMLKAGALAKKKRREKQYLFQLTQQQLLQDRLVRDKLLEAAASKEREFVRLSGEIEAGRTFVKELDRILGIADEAQRGKTLKQYQEWDANVHGAIQGRIDKVLDKMSSKDINERRRGDLDKFLTTTNTKAAVFRDIIIESEYDPLEPNRRAVKAKVGHLRDPCSRVLDKRAQENGLLADEGVGGAGAMLRESFDVIQWEERKVHDTPHGFFAKMMGREAARNKMGGASTTSKTYRSTIKMDDYNVDRGRDIVTKEFPKGKKTYPAGDELAPPSSDAESLIGMG
ncbi:unnamed protein product [Ectocarpus sp. CCAP 1310/34]|nr:unnamed protein product [Ectocarpus sp. CCAP 1310/34]